MADSSLLEDVRLQPTDTGDHDTFSHYVKKTEIEKAILDGIPCTALCGKLWLPQKDFTKYPVCPTCKELWEGLKGD